MPDTTLICTTPGSFEYADADMPELKPGHSILQLKRIGICGTDLHAFEGTQPYFNYPRILGHELAAVISYQYLQGAAREDKAVARGQEE